ncbi:endonuclease I [Chromobacterium amazonense]|uniref:Endonuclease I n=1 Tax=Chromobacterium amazonense TaxID=1382803 RepID=A0A2S9X6A0_9NEIS|nr:endonuclease I [Chromobacterium amazonense]PRP71262.1 endonuclease I [Chromobacterium amazonense]
MPAKTIATTKKGHWSRHKTEAYRSGLEEDIAASLASKGIEAEYESYFIPYVIPASDHKYTPDFLLPNGIIIESKGLFEAEDRKKHVLIKKQYPDLDIRFVFSNPNSKLYKGSPTTYAKWCEKEGFLYSKKSIPIEWLMEPKKPIHPALKEKKNNKK